MRLVDRHSTVFLLHVTIVYIQSRVAAFESTRSDVVCHQNPPQVHKNKSSIL